MRREIWRNFDFWLFGSMVILSIFGIVMIHSAIAGNENLAGIDRRQAIFFGIGIVIILALTIIDYRYWQSLSRWMYVFVMLFLIFVYVSGAARFGSQRWVSTALVDIQPAELAKIVIILVLADYFAKNKNTEHNLLWVIKSFAITGGLVVWVILQPNLSTSIVIMVVWFSMLWISGIKLKYLAAFAGVALVGGVAAFPFLEDYQQLRVINFIFPDPNARHGNAYNVEQALVTIGSGGLFGQGYGHSSQVQLRFLQVRHTDYIFAAMAGEFGMIGVVIVIGLIVFVILRCLRAARLAADPFGALVAYGFAILIFFQTLVNISVNLNLIPVTGLTLPFISYGGSSLVSLMLGIGLVESVVTRHQLRANGGT